DGECDEKDPTTGKALIFMDETGIGPIDFSSGQYADSNDFLAVEYRQQTEVCLHDLGEFDPETGAFISNNQGFLTGRYLFLDLDSFDNPSLNIPPLDPFVAEDNDFRVEFDWDQERQANANLSQAHAYFYITDFRRNVFNADLINRLNIDDERRKNVLYRQFKAELPPPAVEDKPNVLAKETSSFGAQAIFWQQNKLQLEFVDKLAGERKNVWSALYDPHIVAGEYAELVGHWLIEYPGIYPPESSFGGNGWKNNVLPALTDGLSVWAAYRYTGETEVFRNFLYSARAELGSINCGPEGTLTAPRCDQGFETRNVMTFREDSDQSAGHFPVQNVQYPGGTHAGGADLGGLFFSNLYHDIVDQVGLAEQDVDALVLQTHAMIDRVDKFPMRYFGQRLLKAAALLWPDPDDPALSIYHDQIRHTLLVRGIPVDARIPCSFMDADDCCDDTSEPDCAAIGTALAADFLPPSYGEHGTMHQDPQIPLLIESTLPESQPTHFNGLYMYDFIWWFATGYEEPAGDYEYMAYRFLEGSEYGPWDFLLVTNDPDLDIDVPGDPCEGYEPHTNHGFQTFCHVFEERELSNLTLMVEGPHLRWKRNRGRGPNEYEANYMSDTAPAGFRVIDGIKDGFAFTATGTEPIDGRRSVTLSVVDPSLAGSRSETIYDWEVTMYELVRTPGTMDTVSRQTVQFDDALCITLDDLNVDQPIRITLTRTRDGESRSITLDETVRSIDRLHDGDVHGEFNLALNFTGVETPAPGDCVGGTEPCDLGDLNCDGTVNVFDLLALLEQWGTCDDPTPGNCPADLNGDGTVNVFDLLILLENWG
ncbi:MAG: hypothetical protein EA377_00260, partial [Phycisphaerales bacterium]